MSCVPCVPCVSCVMCGVMCVMSGVASNFVALYTQSHSEKSSMKIHTWHYFAG